MSKSVEDPIEGAQGEYQEHTPNGIITPMNSTMAASASRPASGGQPIMEIDDDPAWDDQTEIVLQRGKPYRRASEYPSPSLQHSVSRPDDVATIASTRSLHDRDLHYEEENGRRYVVSYHLPNDEDEQLRMQIIHQVQLTLFDSKLTTVPLLGPTQILDFGTGTGDWAIGIGEAFPECDVTGIDLSAIQPSAVPSNVFFEIFDGEDDDDWTYPEDSFNLVHFRNMNGSIKSWDRICQRVYAHLEPRGWIEIVDFKDQTSQFAGLFNQDSEVQAWFKAMSEATKRLGNDLNLADDHRERLDRIGFKNVKITTKDIPMGLWPEDPAHQNVAKLWLVASLAGLEAMSLRQLTQELGWAPDEVRRMCRLIEKELRSMAMNKDKSRSLTSCVQVIIGQKPLSGPLEVDEEEDDDDRDPLGVDEVQPEGKRLRLSSPIEWRGSRNLSAVGGDEGNREAQHDSDIEMK